MVASGPQTIQSSEKLFAIVNGLLELGEAGVTELAEHVTFHKSTVYIYLQTLRENGLVTKSGVKYRLSLQFLTIGEGVRNQHAVFQKGRAEIDRLAADTGELACLGVPERGIVVIVYEVQGVKATQTIGVGSRLPLVETTMGEAMLAYAEPEDGEESETDGALAAAEHDDELAAHLETIRGDGYVVSTDELGDGKPYIAEPDVGRPRSESHRASVRNRTVAAPVCRDGRLVGVVSVTGPAKRISDEYLDNVRRQVVNTSDLIEQKLTVSYNS